MADPIDYVPEYVQNLVAALAFYADEANWDSIEVEKYSDVLSSWISGPAIDRGERARRALAYAEGRLTDHTIGSGSEEVQS